MTPTEKKSRAEARKAARAQLLEQEKADRALVGAAMRRILSDDTASSREVAFAALVLDNISTCTLVPWKASKLYDNDIDKEAFRAAAEAFKAIEDTTAT